MDELAKELSVLRDDLAPAWSEERAELLFAGVAKLRHKRKVQRIVAGTASAMLGIGLAVMVARIGSQDAAAAASAPSEQAHVALSHANDIARDATQDGQVAESRLSAGHKLRLADGSLAQLLSSEGELDVLRNRRERVDLRLLSGHAHFQVVPNQARPFTVGVGALQVVVVGTVFDVMRQDGQVHVTVFEGRVRVESQAGAVFVSTGETQSFDAAGRLLEVVEAPSAADAAEEEDEVRARKPAPGSARGSKAPWRSLIQAGDYDAAYRALAQGGVVEDEPAALMDAADAARLSNHPQAAVGYLERVVQRHARSPVAPLAAFTLGRVRLERLGQPSEAAAAFARARALSPDGSLAQDALAREVEALSKAGNAREAHLKAEQYVRAYPNGRRVRAVRSYGGLDSH